MEDSNVNQTPIAVSNGSVSSTSRMLDLCLAISLEDKENWMQLKKMIAIKKSQREKTILSEDELAIISEHESIRRYYFISGEVRIPEDMNPLYAELLSELDESNRFVLDADDNYGLPEAEIAYKQFKDCLVIQGESFYGSVYFRVFKGVYTDKSVLRELKDIQASRRKTARSVASNELKAQRAHEEIMGTVSAAARKSSTEKVDAASGFAKV